VICRGQRCDIPLNPNEGLSGAPGFGRPMTIALSCKQLGRWPVCPKLISIF
jgi:hypothetical protein